MKSQRIHDYISLEGVDPEGAKSCKGEALKKNICVHTDFQCGGPKLAGKIESLANFPLSEACNIDSSIPGNFNWT